jgi:Protein of unknown function (DUF2510)
MSKREWHSGPPPSCGWWPASVVKNADSIRWWDGTKWSANAAKFHSARAAESFAKRIPLPYHQSMVKWTERPASWPAWSRT